MDATNRKFSNYAILFEAMFLLILIGISSLFLPYSVPFTVIGSSKTVSTGSVSTPLTFKQDSSIPIIPKNASNSILNSLTNFLFTSTGSYTVSGIAIDAFGNKYITGTTSAANLIPKNASNEAFSGSKEAFVAKFSPTDQVLFSTYLGGNGNDTGNSIAVDSAENCYVTGSTSSSNFPTKDAFNNTYGGNTDVFVAKFTSTGSLVFSTYLGGSDTDVGNSIAVDSAGNSYVTGSTSSSNFPTKNAYNRTYGGDTDVFVTKLTATGGLAFSTYLGGSGTDEGNSIAVDSAGNSYVTGPTSSSNFPTKSAFNSKYGGDTDAFVTKLTATGGLAFSTYLGGSSTDVGNAIAVDSAGNNYITGSTQSNNFPIKNAFNSTYGGKEDGFVAKFTTMGGLVFSTFIGVGSNVMGNGIAVDSAGTSFISGFTYSNQRLFIIKFSPAGEKLFNLFLRGMGYSTQAIAIDSGNDCYTIGLSFGEFSNYNTAILKINSKGQIVSSLYLNGRSYIYGQGIAVDKDGNIYIVGDIVNFSVKNMQENNTGVNSFTLTSGSHPDVFVLKLNSKGDVIFITYLRGAYDSSSSIAVDSAGNSYITGYALSSNFPTKNAYDSTFGGSIDAFVVKLNAAGGLDFSTFLGSSSTNVGTGIAVDSAGNCYVTGYTNSGNFPTKNAYNSTFSGSLDAFVAKFNPTGGLVFSTYLGPLVDVLDYGPSIAVDSSGNSYVAGTSYSKAFPTTENAFNGTFNGHYESFVTKFNSAGYLVFSTYLGGEVDSSSAIAVDSSGNSYVTGYAYSVNFPTTKNALNNTFVGRIDAFMTKFTSTGGLVLSTLVGGSGSGSDVGTGITVDREGNIFLTGIISSRNNSIDTGDNVFDTKLNAKGDVVFSTSSSINPSFFPPFLAIDTADNSYVLGTTLSNFPTKNTSFNTPTGGVSAFLSKFNSSGFLMYNAYVGDMLFSENSTNQRSGVQLSTQTILIMFWSGLLVVVTMGGIYTGVEYRKYAKSKKHVPSLSFWKYLKDSVSRSEKKANTANHVSKEIFEILDEIEEENRPK